MRVDVGVRCAAPSNAPTTPKLQLHTRVTSFARTAPGKTSSTSTTHAEAERAHDAPPPLSTLNESHQHHNRATSHTHAHIFHLAGRRSLSPFGFSDAG